MKPVYTHETIRNSLREGWSALHHYERGLTRCTYVIASRVPSKAAAEVMVKLWIKDGRKFPRTPDHKGEEAKNEVS